MPFSRCRTMALRLGKPDRGATDASSRLPARSRVTERYQLRAGRCALARARSAQRTGNSRDRLLIHASHHFAAAGVVRVHADRRERWPKTLPGGRRQSLPLRPASARRRESSAGHCAHEPTAGSRLPVGQQRALQLGQDMPFVSCLGTKACRSPRDQHVMPRTRRRIDRLHRCSTAWERTCSGNPTEAVRLQRSHTF